MPTCITTFAYERHRYKRPPPRLANWVLKVYNSSPVLRDGVPRAGDRALIIIYVNIAIDNSSCNLRIPSRRNRALSLFRRVAVNMFFPVGQLFTIHVEYGDKSALIELNRLATSWERADPPATDLPDLYLVARQFFRIDAARSWNDIFPRLIGQLLINVLRSILFSYYEL